MLGLLQYEVLRTTLSAAFVSNSVNVILCDLASAPCAPTVKRRLTAVRMLFDWQVVPQIMLFNAASVAM